MGEERRDIHGQETLALRRESTTSLVMTL